MRTEPAREPEPEYAFVVNVDVQGSGLLSDPEKSAMRQRLYEVTGRAFEQTGIREPRLYQEDRGDGVLSVLSAGVPPKQVLGEWLEHLHQNLRAVNAGLAHPLRIRAGMHVGPVSRDAHGLSGRAVDLACRLSDCDLAKQVLAAAHGFWLVNAVSDQVYRDLVRDGGRWIDPRAYAGAEVLLKEGPQRAWFLVPGLPTPPMPSSEESGTSGEAGDKRGVVLEKGDAASGGSVNNNYHYGSGEIISDARIGVLNIGHGAGQLPSGGEK
ncbi:hypothetical protein DN069_08290 [Streptacidiphilus pinicola]|uniref:Guanylate cyclase domain-containing protein n=1 Tax=Streptacidiphilus pinicola TaxID=2219663 RepID=A0A2X0KA49_9ACTN|nr:hypothetical protein [Streptacidiphilus pinicola]RAG86105.1 hypothetical protein DN069_08290 [Streptacidiphilus pinicola]